MKKTMLISIIVPVYNQENNLDISLPAILNQTWHDIEVVCVNDGSTDNSLEILKNYSDHDSRFKIVSQSNQGLVGATITGIRNSTGQYICFVDPDDTIGEDFINNFACNIGENDFLAMGLFLQDNMNIRELTLLENKEYSANELSFYSNCFLHEQGKEGVSNRFYISRWNKMYKREVVLSILEDYEKCKLVSLGEDSIFTFLILNNVKSGRVIKKSNSYYYNVSSPTSMTFNGQVDAYLDKMKIAYFDFENILKSKGKDTTQASYLYYCLGCNLLSRFTNNSKLYSYVFKLLNCDNVFLKGFQQEKSVSKKMKILFFVWSFIKIPRIYLFTDNTLRGIRELKNR